MATSISFSHIINPFAAPAGSEHAIASQVTFASLRQAVKEARAAGLQVEVRAVVLPGDEKAVEPPATLSPRLTRTVQDIRSLRPPRPLPLIKDIVARGVEGATGEYVVFTNMDIAVQPHFYRHLDNLARARFGEGVPFTVYRRNISQHFDRPEQLPEMLVAPGKLGYGFDCFVFPARYAAGLDLGQCCIGSAHFDQLLAMALDAISGFRLGRVPDVPLTFHIGNGIEWSRHMDYIEHNLGEALAAIDRMHTSLNVPGDSLFAHIEKSHFIPNARLDSAVLRKVKRLPAVGKIVHTTKKLLGRSH